MSDIIKSIPKSFGLFRKDKALIGFSLLPLSLGAILYVLMGSWLYSDILPKGRGLIDNFISSDTWGGIVYWLLLGIFTILFFFLINWTFVLVVSIFAGPFNDIISERVEKSLLGKTQDSVSLSFSKMFKKFFFTMWNEFKKVAFILFLTILAFVLGFFPPLAPVSIIISGGLVAWTFLDYSFGRHRSTFGDCIKNYKGSLFNYTLGGLGFFFLLSVPILNLFALPFGVVFFTVLYCNKKGLSGI